MTIKWLGNIIDQKMGKVIRKCVRHDNTAYYVVIEDQDPKFNFIGNFTTLTEAREKSGIYAK